MALLNLWRDSDGRYPSITHRKKNKVMKKVMVALFAVGFASAAHAESTISTTVGIERNLDTEVNEIYFGPTINSGDFSLGITTKMLDTTADQGKFNYTSADVDLKYSVTGNLSLYIENDFDQDFKQTNTVVGGKITF